MSTKVFPPFKYLTGILEYNETPVEDRADLALIILDSETQLFRERHREDYYACDFNAQLMVAWLALRGVPALLWNLEIAFNDLREDGLLAHRPRPTEPAADRLPDNGGINRERWPSDPHQGLEGATLSRGDALAEYQPGDAEAAQLAKLADDPTLNDHQRKVRLRKLALLAGEQRREMATLQRDPDILI